MIITHSGSYFDYNNISYQNIDLEDIIYSLSRINRYLGHTVRPYSVAEHTLRGLFMAIQMKYTPLQQFHWLIHDFTEAYMGDCPSPLKKLLPEFQVLEAKVAQAIMDFFALEPMTEEEQQLVHRIDHTMLILEMRDLTHHDHTLNICNLMYPKFLHDKAFDLRPERYTERMLVEALAIALDELWDNVVAERRAGHGEA